MLSRVMSKLHNLDIIAGSLCEGINEIVLQINLLQLAAGVGTNAQGAIDPIVLQCADLAKRGYDIMMAEHMTTYSWKR